MAAPGLLILASKAIEKTKNRNFIPSIDAWGRFVVKARYISVPIFAVLLILGIWMSQKCTYVYGYTLLDTRGQFAYYAFLPAGSPISMTQVEEGFSQLG